MAKFTDTDYLECRKQGLSQKQMAIQFGVCEAYVSKVKKRCESQIEASTPPVIRAEVLSRQYDALERLAMLADRAHTLSEIFQAALDGDWKAKGKLERLAGRRGAALQAYISLLGELRKLVELDNTIKKTKFDIERVMRFQEAVVQALQKASPELARQVIAELQAVDATVSSLDFGLSESE